MRKIISILLLLLVTACSAEEQPKAETATVQAAKTQELQAPFQSISPSQAVQLIADKTDLLILDARTTREIRQYGAIANSEQADIRGIVQEGLPIPKTQPVLVVCAVGGRSYAVGKFLVKQGHTEIYNLSGGLDNWTKAGMPVVFPAE
ncbi:MAG: rhodanese-like domain-containing protein [Desulfobulbaceae bacterium]|jgi:rhodanese-related sulfurtransferase|nr:rhodanese-like domain-containing protein [Desulfobulbaceae bacterium]